MSAVDILVPAFLGAFCGAAAAWMALASPRLFFLPAALSSVLLGALVALLPLEALALAVAAFCALFLAAFWLVASFWRDDGWRRGGGGGPDDPEPPCWPEFEAQFRSYYARRAARPKSPASTR